MVAKLLIEYEGEGRLVVIMEIILLTVLSTVKNSSRIEHD